MRYAEKEWFGMRMRAEKKKHANHTRMIAIFEAKFLEKSTTTKNPFARLMPFVRRDTNF